MVVGHVHSLSFTHHLGHTWLIKINEDDYAIHIYVPCISVCDCKVETFSAVHCTCHCRIVAEGWPSHYICMVVKALCLKDISSAPHRTQIPLGHYPRVKGL